MMVVIDNYGHGMSQQNDMNTLMAVPGLQGKGKSFLMAPTSSKKCQSPSIKCNYFMAKKYCAEHI